MTDDKFRISAIPSAMNGVTSVKPGDSVKAATTRMLAKDFSQLPVLTAPRTVKGVISWKTIGSATRLGGNPETVQECMDKNVTVLKGKDNILKAVGQIIEHDFVLVKDSSQNISGICTLADIGKMFLGHSRPFIEVEQIEMGIRRLIADKIDGSNVSHIENPADEGEELNDVSNFTFGAYVKWLENMSNWDLLELDIDRKIVIEQLSVVNQIRNRLMYFRTTALDADELDELKRASKFFRVLHKLQNTAEEG